MRIFHYGAGCGKAKRSQIQFVKSVKQVGSEFEVGPLLQARDSESRVLGETQVHGPIPRPAERVASDSWRPGRGDIKERLSAAREVAVFTQENVGRGVVAGAAFVGHGTDRSQPRAAGKQQLLGEGNRRPREAAAAR